jgi:hypothetical protein
MDVSLRDHFQAQCDERMLRLEAEIRHLREQAVQVEKAIDAKFCALEKSTQIIAASLEKRLDGMNEFRDTLRDQAGRFFTRDEHEAYIKVVDVDLRSLRESRARIEGSATHGSVMIASGVAVLGLMLAAIGIVMDLIRK